MVLVVRGASVHLGVLGLCIEAVNLGYRAVVASDTVAAAPRDDADSVLNKPASFLASRRPVEVMVAALGVLTR